MKFFECLKKTNIPVNFLSFHEIVCCAPHRGDSNEYSQHTIIMHRGVATFLWFHVGHPCVCPPVRPSVVRPSVRPSIFSLRMITLVNMN